MVSFSRIKFVPSRSGGGVLALDRSERGRTAEEGEEERNGGVEGEAKTGFGGDWVSEGWNSEQLEWEQVVPPGPGFHNMGNTCFLNASLQCLLHCPPLIHVLNRRMCSSAKGGGKSAGNFCALCALKSLMQEVHGSHASRGCITPRTFVQNRRVICRTFLPGRQEDAHELVRHLLDAMVQASFLGCGRRVAEGGKRLTYQQEMKTVVHSAFGGCLQSAVVCMSCHAVSTVNEPFLDLSLEINNTNSVAGALDKFTASERLDGANKYRCEKCKKHVVAQKRITIRRAPNILSLHLKRFDHLKKNSKHVNYNEKLDLKPYMSGCPADTQARYHLVAVLIHEGSTIHAGHYYSYVKNSNGTWSLKDDETSRQVGLQAALRQNAYILFYVRDRPTEVKRKAPVEVPSALPKPMHQVSLQHTNSKVNGFSRHQSGRSSDDYYSARSLSLRSLLNSEDGSEHSRSDGERDDSSDDGHQTLGDEDSGIDEESEGARGKSKGRGVPNGSQCTVDSSKKGDDGDGHQIVVEKARRQKTVERRDAQSTSTVTESTKTLESDAGSANELNNRQDGSRDRGGSQDVKAIDYKRFPREGKPQVCGKVLAHPFLSFMSLSKRSALRLKASAYTAKIRSRVEKWRRWQATTSAAQPNGHDENHTKAAPRAVEPAATTPVNARADQQVESVPRSHSAGTVFPEAGGWDDDVDPEESSQRSVARTIIASTKANVPTKRQRHGDSYDAEYDRGKTKRVKAAGPSGSAKRNGPRSGAFDDVAERKKENGRL